MAKVVLGVSGGIAAYKAVLLLRLLTKSGHDVTVVPTAAALEFVGRPTWQALSHNPVHTSVFDDVTSAEHVRLGKSADLVIVAPATADLLARARTGQANDLLTATLLMATCPVVLAPAMHTEMWQHPATRENVEVLRARGIHIIEPAAGELAGEDSGPGRLPEPEAIMGELEPYLSGGFRNLSGREVVITAGGTREALDPVRFLGNRSSGLQGIAIARAAATAGATVRLIAANVDETLLSPLSGIQIERVVSASDLEETVRSHALNADAIVMAAAVADFRPKQQAHKIKKESSEGLMLELEQTPDILAGLVASRRNGQLVIGFAAETGDAGTSALDHARAKAVRKGADLLVFNDVSGNGGFGDVPNTVVFLDKAGNELGRASGSKADVGRAVVHEIALRLGDTGAH